jgi:hypothetical protein
MSLIILEYFKNNIVPSMYILAMLLIECLKIILTTILYKIYILQKYIIGSNMYINTHVCHDFPGIN